MKTTHAITGSPTTYAHLLVLATLTLLATMLVPYAGPELRELLAEHAVNLGILYAIVVAFVMSITLERRNNMDEAVAIELNKIRRIYHLALHLAKADGPDGQKWFKEMEQAIAAYLERFQGLDFVDYEKGNTLFRRITYTIYEVPQRLTSYNSELYHNLLDAAGSATEAREHIRAKLEAGIGRFQWATLLFITVLFATTISAATAPDPMPRTVSAIVNMALVLMLLLVYEHDHFNPRKRRALAVLYVRNWELIKNPDTENR